VEYGYLGVRVRRPLLSEREADGLASPGGAYVAMVEPDAPAELAGIRAGDILLVFDGVPVESDDHLTRLVGMAQVGSAVEIRLLRHRRHLTIPVGIVRRHVPEDATLRSASTDPQPPDGAAI
jgi:serine protease Do